MRDGLRRACLEIKELGLTKDEDVTVYIVRNPHPSYDGGPVIVIVELLFDKTERTLEVRQRLAASLGEVIKAYYRRCPMVNTKKSICITGHFHTDALQPLGTCPFCGKLDNVAAGGIGLTHKDDCQNPIVLYRTPQKLSARVARGELTEEDFKE